MSEPFQNQRLIKGSLKFDFHCISVITVKLEFFNKKWWNLKKNEFSFIYQTTKDLEISQKRIEN